jgi:hypothetical protein
METVEMSPVSYQYCLISLTCAIINKVAQFIFISMKSYLYM